MINWRIICAMLNFSMSNPDNLIDEELKTASEIKKLKIVQRIKEKIKIKMNPLRYFMKSHPETSRSRHINISSITDFPKLSYKTLENKNFLGEFHLKQSKSYMNEFKIKRAVFEQHNPDKDKSQRLKYYFTIKNAKLIACRLSTKHQASKEDKDGFAYKVWILYKPNKNKSSAILGK